MKKVLLLGASGEVAPNIIPGLEQFYDLRLADVNPHPDGKPTLTVDITSYEQVLEAARGVEAILNFTVIRQDPVLSFTVNIQGMYNVVRAAHELGIKKILQTGPTLIVSDYGHDFELSDVPLRPGTGYYYLTKYLSLEICRIYARAHNLQIVCFLFKGLGPKPAQSIVKRDFPNFTIVWEDLVHACRLALEAKSVPDNFQVFNMHSSPSHGKYSIEKAEKILGFRPLERIEDYFKRRDASWKASQ